MATRTASAALLPWLLRGVLLLVALSAPIVTYRAFTDSETPDPQREQRLREVNGPQAAPRKVAGDNTYPPYDQRP